MNSLTIRTLDFRAEHIKRALRQMGIRGIEGPHELGQGDSLMSINTTLSPAEVSNGVFTHFGFTYLRITERTFNHATNSNQPQGAQRQGPTRILEIEAGRVTNAVGFSERQERGEA